MYKINQSIALSRTDFSDVCMGIIAMLDTTACGGGPVSRNQHTCDSHSHDESLSNKDIEYDIGNIPGHGQSLRNIVKYSYDKHAYNELMLTSTCISKVIFIPLNFKKNIVHIIIMLMMKSNYLSLVLVSMFYCILCSFLIRF